MTHQPILIDHDDGVMTVTINAPDMRNSLGAPGVRDALTAAVQSFFDEETHKVLVLTGAGGNFSAGGNLNVLKDSDAIEMRRGMERGSWLYRQIILGEKPVIAAVEGAAFGAGLGLALCCDTVVAARSARFCSAFVRIGAIPDAGLFWSLPFRAGPAKARDMMIYGDEIGAEEALRIGLADRLAEPGQALSVAQGLAKRLRHGPPLAIRRIKTSIRLAPMSLDAALQIQLDNAPQLFASEDFKEGARSFLEKRKPVFKGR